MQSQISYSLGKENLLVIKSYLVIFSSPASQQKQVKNVLRIRRCHTIL